MSGELNDEALIAYVDGELPREEIVEVERRLKESAAARALVRDLRAGTTRLRAACNIPADRPMPAGVLRALSAGPQPLRAQSERGAARDFARRWFSYGLAASIAALAVGLSAGFLFADWRIEQKLARLENLRQAEQQQLAAAISRILETQVSGTAASWSDPAAGTKGEITPQRTFKSASGSWCREFTLELQEGSTITQRQAIACREGDGQWRLRVELLGDI